MWQAIIAGIPVDAYLAAQTEDQNSRETSGTTFVDGIFYGLAWKLGWLDYRVGNQTQCMDYEVPAVPARSSGKRH